MKNARVVLLASGKGGTGKTTTAVNVGCGLSKLGQKVLILDMNRGFRCCDCYLGLENQILSDLSDLREGRKSLDQVLIEDRRHPGLFLLCEPQRLLQSMWTSEEAAKFLDFVKPLFDWILIDLAPGYPEDLSNLLPKTDEVWTVVTGERAALRAADQIFRTVPHGSVRKVLFLNRIIKETVNEKAVPDADEIRELLAPDEMFQVPEDDQLVYYQERGVPIAGMPTKSGQAFAGICRKLISFKKS